MDIGEREGQEQLSIDASKIAELAISLWRIGKRAQRDPATPEPVVIACEMARDRLSEIGFDIREMVGLPYHENMRVRVVDHEPASQPLQIIECLTPAIYFHDSLLRPAEVVIKGEQDGTTDR